MIEPVLWAVVPAYEIDWPHYMPESMGGVPYPATEIELGRRATGSLDYEQTWGPWGIFGTWDDNGQLFAVDLDDILDEYSEEDEGL